MIEVWLGYSALVIIAIAALLIGFRAQSHMAEAMQHSHRSDSTFVRYLQDKHDLNRIGFAQQLTRHMSSRAVFAIPFSTMALVIGAAFLIVPAFRNAGPTIIGYGWPVLGIMALATMATLAQYASSLPTSGGLYHWVAVIGKRRIAVFVGFIHLTSSLLLLASTNLIIGQWLDELIASYFEFETSVYSLSAIVGVLFLSQIAFSIRKAVTIGTLFERAIWIHTIIIVGFLVYIAWFNDGTSLLINEIYSFEHPRLGSMSDITFTSYIVGLLLLQRMFQGIGDIAHSAEETIEPRVNVPWAMYYASVYTVIIGFIVAVVLFIYYPLDPYDQNWWLAMTNWITLLWDQWSWLFTSLIFLAVVWAGWSSGLSSLHASSRTLFSMARDRIIPGSRFMKQISVSTRAPIVAVIVAGTLSLILLGVYYAFYNRLEIELGMFIQLIAASTFLSSLAIFILLALTIIRQFILIPDLTGPWQIGRLGRILEVVTIIWMVVLMGISGFVIKQTNWLIIGSLAVLFIIFAFWRFRNLIKRHLFPKKRQPIERLNDQSLDELVQMERQYPQH